MIQPNVPGTTIHAPLKKLKSMLESTTFLGTIQTPGPLVLCLEKPWKTRSFPRKRRSSTWLIRVKCQSGSQAFEEYFYHFQVLKGHIFVNGFIGEGYSFEDSLPAHHGKSLGVWLLLRSPMSGGVLGGQLGSFLRWISPTIVVARINPPMTPVDHLWN